MKALLASATLGLALTALTAPVPNASRAVAAEKKPLEATTNIIAVQIRKQGYECTNPQSAERDASSGNPDDPVWTLKCDNATYRVHLIPNMAATVEKLADGEETKK